MNPRIGIIGGSGVYNPELFTLDRKVKMDTPYGETSGDILVGSLAGVPVAFLPRHGEKHQFPPHMVPYHANLYALKQLGVEMIISPCAVGSLQEEYRPGEIVVVDQFIDFTKTRDYTYFDGPQTVHISIPEPFCPELSRLFSQAADELGIKAHDKGTYVCIEGPRFSTKGESRMFRNFAEIIGMTLVPECQLARELGMCYVSLAMITDYDVWKDNPVDLAMVLKTMGDNLYKVSQLLEKVLPQIPPSRRCSCAEAADVEV
ncbi:MAG: S-methyl-5'-thioadenosine phosphorylase [Candidatus Methanomethylophilaceae archaeon]|nr:S-methyl-5'-thioadenosine phosphorylase [Candidatus Methanomethylophilaceae archaeon]